MKKNKENIKVVVKLLVSGGAANISSFGSALGPHGVNIGQFCQQFNAQVKDRAGETVPVDLTVFKDRTFSFIVKSAPTSELLIKAAGVKKGRKGTAEDSKSSVGMVTRDQVLSIAKIKLPDLSAFNLDAAYKCVAGTAKSIGLRVEETESGIHKS